MIQASMVFKNRLRVLKKGTNTSVLVKKTDYNTKMREIENKITSISGLLSTVDPNTKATFVE